MTYRGQPQSPAATRNVSHCALSLTSYGPDRDYDAGEWFMFGDRIGEVNPDIVYYDPTNGTISNGDVVRMGP